MLNIRSLIHQHSRFISMRRTNKPNHLFPLSFTAKKALPAISNRKRGSEEKMCGSCNVMETGASEIRQADKLFCMSRIE